MVVCRLPALTQVNRHGVKLANHRVAIQMHDGTSPQRPNFGRYFCSFLSYFFALRLLRHPWTFQSLHVSEHQAPPRFVFPRALPQSIQGGSRIPLALLYLGYDCLLSAEGPPDLCVFPLQQSQITFCLTFPNQIAQLQYHTYRV